MARTSVICETPEVVRQLTESLKQSEDVGHIGRMKNGFGSTAVGRGGYRDIKVNLQPANFAHYVEVQVRGGAGWLFLTSWYGLRRWTVGRGSLWETRRYPPPPTSRLWVIVGYVCTVPVMIIASLSLTL